MMFDFVNIPNLLHKYFKKCSFQPFNIIYAANCITYECTYNIQQGHQALPISSTNNYGQILIIPNVIIFS